MVIKIKSCCQEPPKIVATKNKATVEKTKKIKSILSDNLITKNLFLKLMRNKD
ncbi:MAG: hypothetical protein BWY51_00910 [Parcubacteria group bacterium ADurb.Bin316]|nr:MAG: hypothetical protein BWY51_00910 [Parcubacteria group bacterium ADurb.Bin316]